MSYGKVDSNVIEIQRPGRSAGIAGTRRDGRPLKVGLPSSLLLSWEQSALPIDTTPINLTSLFSILFFPSRPPRFLSFQPTQAVDDCLASSTRSPEPEQ